MSATTSTPAAVTDAGIVFALAVEADAFERLVEGRREFRASRLTFHTGSVAGRAIAWCVSGIGGEAAEAATRQLIAGHRPGCVITAGFAGALDPGLSRGGVIRGSRAVREGDAPPVTLAWLGPAAPPLTIVSVDTVVATVDAKRDLAARTGGQAVDMETHAVACVAGLAGLPCHSVRVISDDAHESLPAEVAGLAAARSPLRRLGAVVGALGRRPAVARDMWRLWEHAVIDSRTLAAAIADLIGRLP
jgi:adenosylhomocysteine nucleosidase